MSNIVPTKTLQERVADRIREQIGELLTTEDLTKLVEQAVQEAFFKPIEKKDGYHTVTSPPVVVTLIRGLLAEKVQVEVVAWMASHSDEVSQIIDTVMKDGIANAVMSAINARMAGDFWTLGESLKSKLNVLR